MKITRLSILTILSMAVLVCGCETLSSNNSSQNINTALLEPAMNPKIPDIPIPAGLKPAYKESYFFENAGMRVGVLKYKGKANPDFIVNFFKEQLSMNNWTLLNVIEYNNRLLNFEREKETCIINVEPQGGFVTVTISLGPKSQQDMSKKGKEGTGRRDLLK
jgi:hypothetical protein